jgi:hypothetical protein
MNGKTKKSINRKKIEDDVINEYLKKVGFYLWIRLINRLFGENIDENAAISMEQTKFIELVGTSINIVVMDTLISIEKTEDGFHIELQTESDSKMLIRMMEYGCQYAIKRMSNYDVNEFKFPRQIVIYIEKNRNISDFLECKVIFGKNNELIYQIPTLKIFDKEISEFNDDLILLIPFKISELNKEIKAGKNKKQIKEKLHSLTNEVLSILSNAHNRNVINDIDYNILINAVNFIFSLLYNKLKEYEEYEKEVINMVKTLTLEEKRQIREESEKKGRKEGIEKGISALKELYEEGIITKDVYEKRVKKLKDELQNIK